MNNGLDNANSRSSRYKLNVNSFTVTTQKYSGIRKNISRTKNVFKEVRLIFNHLSKFLFTLR